MPSSTRSAWHYPQQRIITLWEDVAPTLSNQRPPELFIMRMNTYDCAKYLHTTLGAGGVRAG